MPSSLTELGGSGGAVGKRRATARVAPGDVVGGRYVIEEVLGTGGMGFVVAARHQALGHRVAMKFVSASTSADADAFIRFSREARIIASLESDHVVRVVDYGMHAGKPYMAMDLLTGRDLGRELQMSGPLPVDEAADYVIEACDGLAAAHAKGIVHRDVKLANLFLALRADGERVIKVLDFGVSKLQAEACDDVDLTRTASMIGSPLYMSPEQIRDARAVDHRADIWSLGIVLHKLLTGQAPFTGQTTTALCAAVAADPPTTLRAHAQALPARLEAIVLCCLEKRPDRRYPSVASLARDLAQFASPKGRLVAEQLVARATADGVLEPSPVDSSPGEDGPAEARSVAATARSSRIRPEETYSASVVEHRPHRERRATWGWLLAVPAIATLGVVLLRARPHPTTAADTPVLAASAPSAAAALSASSRAVATGGALSVPNPPAPSASSTAPVPPVQKAPPMRRLLPAPRAPGPSPAAPPKPRPTAAPATAFGGSALDDHQ
jgi:serine/threonine-protein kinase